MTIPSLFARAFHRPLRSLLAAAALAASVGLTQAAHAQLGSRTAFGESFQPDIMQRDLTLITQILQLEEWQRPIVEALVEDYSTAFMSGAEATKERMKQAAIEAAKSGNASGPGDVVLAKVMEKHAQWRQEKQQIFERFVASLKSQLGPQQQELWPKFERALRRERQLHEGELSGESVDVWLLMNRMQLSPAEQDAVRPVLDTYEVALDQALVNRMSNIARLEGDVSNALQTQDFSKAQDIQDSIMQLRILVRNTNEEGVANIAQALGGERGEEFRRLAMETGYKDAFRPHPVLTLIDQALQIETLTPEQITQIKELRADLEKASDDYNQRFYQMLRDEEPKIPRRKLQWTMEKKANGGQRPQPTPQSANNADPIVKMRAEREQMGEPYRVRLMAILTPEQQPMLPGGAKLDPSAVRPKDPDAKNQPTFGQEQVSTAAPSNSTRDGARGKGRAPREGRRDPRGAAGGAPSGAPGGGQSGNQPAPPANGGGSTGGGSGGGGSGK